MVQLYLTHFQQLSRNVKIFLAGNALQAIGLSIYSLLFNLYLKELGFGESAIGGLISTTSLGISFMAIPAALILEKFHVKHLVIVGMGLSSLFYFVQVTHVSESTLFTFGLLASMFQALYNISVAPFYLRNSTPQVRVHLFAMNSSMNIGAHLIGYLLGGYLPAISRWFNPEFTRVEQYRAAMMVAIGIVFLSNLVFLRIKRVAIPKVKKRIFDGFREKEWKLLTKLVGPRFFLAFGSGLIVPFMNLYLKERFSFSAKMIGVSYALLQFFILVGIFVTPQLMKRTTPLRFIMLTSTLAVPFMIFMGVTGNIGIVLSCFFMRGMLMNMSSPITSVFEMERVREKECIFASAIIMFFYHFFYMFGTRLGGVMIEKYSFGPTFYVSGFCYAIAAVLYYHFFKGEEKKAEPVPSIAEAA